jgi:hypothetical protein
MVTLLMLSTTLDPQVYERLGGWTFGTVRVTYQAPNKLSFRDRLEMVDGTMFLNQLVECDGGATIVHSARRANDTLWYPIVRTSMVRSVDREMREGDDFDIADGTLRWRGTPPAKGTRLSVTYEMHPVFRVLDHTYAIRDAYVEKKAASDKAMQHKEMPRQVLAKLDFLLGGEQ